MEDLKWVKSSFSGSGNCLEVATGPAGPDGGVVTFDFQPDKVIVSGTKTDNAVWFTPDEWRAFLAGADAGELNPKTW